MAPRWNKSRNHFDMASVTRRKLLKGGLLVTATFIPGIAKAGEWLRLPEKFRAKSRVVSGPIGGDAARIVSFYNIHTGERLSAIYFENGQYIPDALQEVNYFFRDFRANQVKPIDPRLLDLLYDIRIALDTQEPFVLISGYRSPATNAMLASRGEGVSRHSMHIEGRAADIAVPGRALSLVQSAALAMRAGGVGYYPHSGFVHVDTGRVRHW
jgi:uncharacterized protein YcbK (DUF882 family)